MSKSDEAPEDPFVSNIPIAGEIKAGRLLWRQLTEIEGWHGIKSAFSALSREDLRNIVLALLAEHHERRREESGGSS